MNLRKSWILMAALATGACDDLLSVDPPDRVSEETAITDAASAQAALNGAYSSLTGGSYYGGTLVFFGDLPTDNAEHGATGTLQSYGELDRNDVRADNGSVDGMWSSLYSAISRTNTVLDRVPQIDMRDADRDRILGEAHFLRALHYFNLVRFWGGVPLILAPVTNVDEASLVTRASAEDVYAQVLADLEEASALLAQSSDPTIAGEGAVQALLSRVLLYTGDYAGSEAAANAVVALGYDLAEDYGELFVDGTTEEDIFKVIFTPDDFNNIGYYYHGASCGGGRGEVAPTDDLAGAYEAGDARFDWTILEVGSGLCGDKYPTTLGAEDVHVIRFAEVLLNLAEAHARQNELEDAVDAYNQVRERAGLDPHVLGVDVTTQDDVIEAILQERRVELALEGDRWTDLIRTGDAVALLGIDPFQQLFPIPQSELDVAPNLEQNPGY